MNKAVLHIINIPWYSGLARYAVDMADFSDFGNEEIIFAVNGDSVLYNKLKGLYKVIDLPGRGVFDSLKGVYRIYRSKIEVNYIVAHTGSSFFIGMLYGILKKIPVYRVRAEKGSVAGNIFNRFMHNIAEKIIVPTEAIKNDYSSMVSDKEKVFYLPPVVNTANYTVSDLSEVSRIAVVGRLDPVKGHSVMIKSIKDIVDGFGEIEVIFAGGEVGVKWEELREHAAKLGVEKYVKYLGYIEDSKIPELMRSCRLGVVSSIGSEAVSRVALEWMACGRPVVASSVGSLQEIVKDSETGFLVPPADSGMLAEKIIEILKNKDLNVKMGQNARKYVEEKYSPGIYKERLRKLYE